MADGQGPEGLASGSQIHPLLRQRMLNRAATFSEGAQSSHPLMRRRSSLLSDYSDTRHSFRSSTDNLIRPGVNDTKNDTSSDEPTVWHSAPLAFAILPAVGGLLFQNGSSVVTDVLLLLLASLFLNWCVRAPWEWYHAAQRVEYIQPDRDEPRNDIILEEREEDEGSLEGERETPERREPVSTPADEASRPDKDALKPPSPAQESAYRELGREQIYALLACFIGPVLGAYLLHTIRSQLTRPSEGLVSNYNLTIFVMAAELRPVSHVIKLKQQRLAQVQRIARYDPGDRLTKGDAQEMTRRLVDIEGRLAEPLGHNDSETLKISSTVRQGLQPQLDALNRAVRRYEKRQAAQSIQVEARFADMELRLKDALSLAAAAARTGQKPGIMSICLTWISGVLTYWLQALWAMFMLPFKIAAYTTEEAKALLVGGERPQGRVQGKGNGHLTISTSRTRPRSGR